MARKRMFSNSVIDDDAFLDLSDKGQILYFHLSMKADDDGFINNPKSIARMVGASPDEVDELANVGFVIKFDSGVIAIRHWLINNTNRKDRSTPTTSQEELGKLRVMKDGMYELIEDIPSSETPLPKPQPIDNQVAPKEQPPKVSQPKQSGFNKIEKEAAWMKFWSAYPKKKDKKNAEKKFKKICVNNEILESIMESLKLQKKTPDWLRGNGQFVPNPSTWLNGERWEDEVEIDEDEMDDFYGKAEEIEMSEEERLKLIEEIRELRGCA